MNTEKQIENFNNTNAPFYVVAHDDGRFSLCLPIALLSDEYYPYCQTAFDNYAKEIGDEVCDERGLKTHGNGYEWEAAFREAFADEPNKAKSLTVDICSYLVAGNRYYQLMRKLHDIFFGSHQKRKGITTPAGVGQYGFIKKSEKALLQADFSKNSVMSFSAHQAMKKAIALCNCFFQLYSPYGERYCCAVISGVAG